jgi:hypothetical protein
MERRGGSNESAQTFIEWIVLAAIGAGLLYLIL